MLTGNELITALAVLPTPPAQGVAYRSVPERFANTPLSTTGSLVVGGRYNSPQSFTQGFGALYLADTRENARREVRILVETAAGLLEVQAATPRTEFTIEYKLNSVIDLTEENIQTALGTNLQELTGLWLVTFNAKGNIAPTQALGVAAYNLQSIEALKVPSALVYPNSNLVVFTDRLSSGSFLRAYDDSGMLIAQLP